MPCASVSGGLETKVLALSIGTPSCVVVIMLVTLSVTWCNLYWKRKRGGPEDSNRSANHTLHPINTDACIAHRRLPDHPRIQSGDATAHQEGVYHIYQNPEEDHSLQEGMMNDLGNPSPVKFIFRPLHDLSYPAGEGIVQCQDTTANTKIEHYMDMSGTVKKKKANGKFLQSMDTSETERDVDENGYLISNRQVTLSDVETFKAQFTTIFFQLRTILHPSENQNMVTVTSTVLLGEMINTMTIILRQA
ncbi:uncharacterized protein [Diadema antillarum]|uniref:uncharacterized protein n=1 Tax=Diadema antillarum TaxID=105358 RepID=UPI003A8BFD23